ncbi:MAG: zinc permease [Flavobacteriales bacterium]|nr:MAG: zinc permease [Flavobacteriales bacterium]
MIISVLIFSVVLGVVLGRNFGQKEGLVKILLIVSAGFLISICVNEIFPKVYEHHDLNLGIWVIVGVLLQMILENLTKGFEHGHIHHHGEKTILPFTLVIGLFVHAFIEGIPLAKEQHLSPYLQGIFLHKLPISFILGAFLFRNKKFSSFSSWLIVGVFALASPLAIWVGRYFPANFEPYILAIVGGIFLHISSVIIFESNKNHNVDWQKIGWVILGIALAFVTHLFHHH